MAGIDIQAKIRKGLKKARAKTGQSGLGLVELKQVTGGSNDPINPVDPAVSWVELVDCAFKSIDAKRIDGDLIRAGDIEFAANADVEIVQNDILRRAGAEYVVTMVTDNSAYGLPLAYVGIARAQ